MAELDLNVNVKTKGANKLDGLGSSLLGLGRVAAIGIGAATAGVSVLGAAVGKMAIDAEDADAKLKNTFKSMKAGAFTSIPALNAQAEALAKATTFDDEGIKDAQATMLTFGKVTGETFDRALVASTDLAAFFKTDVTSASLTLGKALNDPVKGLTRLTRQGIVFTEQQEAQIAAMTAAGDVAGAQAIILGELERQVGGTATALAETTGGQIAQAMEDLGEAGESIGTLLLPVFAALAQAVAGFARFIVENMPIIQSVIGNVISTISGIFSGASGSVSGLQQIFQGLVAWVQANLPTIMSVAGQVFGAVGNVVKSVMPVLIELAKVVLPAIGIAASVLFKALDIAFKGIGGAFEVLGNVFDTVSGAIKDIFAGVVGFVRGVWNAFVGVWNGIQISVPSIEIPFVGTVGGFAIGLPDLPMLAEGGIVNQPTLALIGERGPEAVVPLDKMPAPSFTSVINIKGEEPFIRNEDDLIRTQRRIAFLAGF